MGSAFDRWLKSLSEFQSRRGTGAVAAPWGELEKLESRIGSLATESLRLRSVAACLLELEKASLLLEERRFDESFALASNCKASMKVFGPHAELINSNRALILGNIYLIRDEHHELASELFSLSIETSGALTPLIRANAAFNLGICQNLQGQDDEALKSYEIAAESYEVAGRTDKIGEVLHAVANTHRNLGETDLGIEFLMKALNSYKNPLNYMGVWRAADDLSRAYLTLSVERPEEREDWIEHASNISDVALGASTQVWKTLRSEELRLADLSDQMLNLTSTRCQIAMLEESPDDMLATLSVMKGRIRLTRSSVPPLSLQEKSKEFRAAIDEGVPYPHLELVQDSLEELSGNRTIALLDHFALNGNELSMAYVVPKEKRFGGYYSCIDQPPSSAKFPGLRGKHRGIEITQKCQTLLQEICSHGNRCAMALPNELEEASVETQSQLRIWEQEFSEILSELGELFFPGEVLDEFRNLGVDHIVLCVDPLFARTPFQALIGKNGPILDEPWDLSIVTSSMEIVRIAARQKQPDRTPKPLHWLAPDAEVNTNRGGDAEISIISELLSSEEFREDEATVDQMLASLSNGHLCHFRGHGQWSGRVHTSGPVLANEQILSSERFAETAKQSGFLFTSACLTGFGEAVGSEMQGSIVDYDRAGLFGAVLTNWPIHGDAATVFSKFYYRELVKSGNAAQAVRVASLECRAIMPHPYLWAPFTLIGGWELSQFFGKNNV